jgi:hypothetical protein
LHEDERLRRLAANEALFRKTNEHIEHLADDVDATLGSVSRTLAIVCECADGACIARIDVPRAVYERTRADSTCFIVVLGHDAPDLEEIVEHAHDYTVVRKRRGPATAVAQRTDPRTP